MNITFKDLKELKDLGFEGFVKMSDLHLDNSKIPSVRGVYIILYTEKKDPTFLKIGTGGHFKGKNPNVEINELESNWIKNTVVINIGKAGSLDSSVTLRKRLDQYLKFGNGKNIGHWGGRYIWQLSNSKDLVVCWKLLPDQEPIHYEQELIQAFKKVYKNRPFANLRD
jgi:hypothetical protein